MSHTLSMEDRRAILVASLLTPTVNNSGDKHAVRWGLPILWWGPPGVAKSAYHAQVAFEIGLGHSLEVLSPGERGEGGFGDVPVPTQDGKFIDYPVPRWAERYTETEGRGIILCDEFTTAEPRIQAALLSLILDRRIGGRHLGYGVRVLAAANPPDIAANGNNLSLPLANRMIHLNWAPPTVEEVTAHWSTLGGAFSSEKGEEEQPPRLADLEAEVLRRWPEAFAYANGVASSFLKAMPHRLMEMPKTTDPEGGLAWASPRSWELAIRCLAAARIHALSPEQQRAMVAGCVGTGITAELYKFAANLDLPSAEEILDGKVEVNPGDRLDRLVAMMTSMLTFAKGMDRKAGSTTPRMVKFWGVLDKVSASKPDVAWRAALPALQTGLHAVNKDVIVASTPVTKALHAAGVQTTKQRIAVHGR